MKQLETDQIRRGQPPYEVHQCFICENFFDTSARLSSHGQDAKKGKVKCESRKSQNALFALPQSMIGANIGPKQMLDTSLRQLCAYEYLPMRQQESSTSADTIELLGKRLRSTDEWAHVQMLCQNEDYDLVPSEISQNFALSFLTQTCQQETLPLSYLASFTKMITALQIRKIPSHLLIAFKPFLQKFRPSTQHKLSDLIILFEFTKAVGEEWEWLSYCEDRAAIIITTPANFLLAESGPLAAAFANEFDLYSSSFFATFEQLMSGTGLQIIMAQYIDDFFGFVKDGRVKKVSYQLLLEYKKFRLGHLDFDLRQQANKLRACTSQLIPDEEVIQLVRLSLKHDEKIIMEQIQQRQTGEDMATFVARLEDVLMEQQKRKLSESQKHQQLLEEEATKNAIEGEQKRIAVEEERQRFQQLEEEKRHEETKQQLQEQQFRTSLRSSFDLFASQNQFREGIFEQIESLIADLQKIAATINKILRPEQLVALGLLLLSQKHAVLIQLATGFGKSMLLGVLAQYLNKETANKVIVVVPTAFLHLYQERNYCPTASDIPDNITVPAYAHIFYCSFETFLQPNFILPPNTVLLVDEFHELFFSYPLSVIGGHFISVIQRLMAAKKVIGMSATFRGNAGIQKMQTILKDSSFISSPQEFKEKQLQLNVFGELTKATITGRAIALAKEKSQHFPVIIFCSSELQCEEWQVLLPGSRIFGGSDAGELVALLQQFEGLSQGIVLTTSSACKGTDFVFAVPQAFVIHSVLPQTWLQLQQDSGRGVRRCQELPIIGAIFTEKSYTNQEQVKSALSFADRYDKLFTRDYATAHSLLALCAEQNTSRPTMTFENAVHKLNAGASAFEISKILNTVKRFQPLLSKEVPQLDFIAPLPPNPLSQSSQAKVIPLRATQQSNDFANFGSLGSKKPTSTGGTAGTLDRFFRKRPNFSILSSSGGFDQLDLLDPEITEQNAFDNQKATTQISKAMEVQERMAQNDDAAELESNLEESKVELTALVLQQHAQQQEEIATEIANEVLKKRDKKQVSKQNENWEKQSKMSSHSSMIRSTNGRYEAKYTKVGQKTGGGNVVKEVEEENWRWTHRDKGNSYYDCKKEGCNKTNVRKDARKFHCCKQV